MCWTRRSAVPRRGWRFGFTGSKRAERLPAGGSAVTNGDGRTDGPLLDGAALTAGVYEIEFEAGAYHRAAASGGADTPFLDTVPVRFGISDAGANYHVPLLLSPFGYSTYRGS